MCKIYIYFYDKHIMNFRLYEKYLIIIKTFSLDVLIYEKYCMIISHMTKCSCHMTKCSRKVGRPLRYIVFMSRLSANMWVEHFWGIHQRLSWFGKIHVNLVEIISLHVGSQFSPLSLLSRHWCFPFIVDTYVYFIILNLVLINLQCILLD